MQFTIEHWCEFWVPVWFWLDCMNRQTCFVPQFGPIPRQHWFFAMGWCNIASILGLHISFYKYSWVGILIEGRSPVSGKQNMPDGTYSGQTSEVGKKKIEKSTKMPAHRKPWKQRESFWNTFLGQDKAIFWLFKNCYVVSIQKTFWCLIQKNVVLTGSIKHCTDSTSFESHLQTV